MSKSRNLEILRSRSKVVTSGFCFIGSLTDNFHLIVKCPIYVYVVIKKAFAGSSVPVSFFTGTMPLTDIVLPQFKGRFIYRDSSGHIRKYHSAFVYPLDLNYKASYEEYQRISALLSVLETNKFQFFYENDRSIKTLFSIFAKDLVEYLDSLVQAFDAADPGAPAIPLK